MRAEGRTLTEEEEERERERENKLKGSQERYNRKPNEGSVPGPHIPNSSSSSVHSGERRVPDVGFHVGPHILIESFSRA